jgi:hydrogenase small subunit
MVVRQSGFKTKTAAWPDPAVIVSTNDEAAENCEKLEGLLAEKGISRRRFLQFCGAVAVALGLSEAFAPFVQEAIAASVIGKTEGKLAPVIWLELASCTGCTESFAQVNTPDVATVVLELISLNYSETLSAGAGYSLEEAKEQTIEAGGQIVVFEGAVMEGWDGNALRIANEKGTEIVKHAIKNAKAVVCIGSCAVDGGWQAAKPNPGGAIGVQQFLKKALAAKEIDKIPPLINIPSCPANPEHVVAVLVDVLLLEMLPELDRHGKPSLMFGQFIHDNCPRRGHFENGEFVSRFGSVEEKKGYCLYKLGCKGPQTKSNCPIVRWNRRVSWCVESGAPCIGCAVSDPTSNKNGWVDMNAPFLKRFRSVSLAGLTLQPATIAVSIGGLVAVALAAHGFGMVMTGRTKGGAPFEVEREWDVKHPDEAYSLTISEAGVSPEAELNQAEPTIQEGGE